MGTWGSYGPMGFLWAHGIPRSTYLYVCICMYIRRHVGFKSCFVSDGGTLGVHPDAGSSDFFGTRFYTWRHQGRLCLRQRLIYMYTYPIHIYIYTHIYNIHPWVGHDLLSRSCEKATTVMKSVSSPNIIENM